MLYNSLCKWLCSKRYIQISMIWLNKGIHTPGHYIKIIFPTKARYIAIQFNMIVHENDTSNKFMKLGKWQEARYGASFASFSSKNGNKVSRSHHTRLIDLQYMQYALCIAIIEAVKDFTRDHAPFALVLVLFHLLFQVGSPRDILGAVTQDNVAACWRNIS